MSESDPIRFRPRESGGFQRTHGPQRANGSASSSRSPPVVAFDRAELDAILAVYARKVAAGEWRDYAIDHLRDRAVFSVFRRTSEVPLFQVVKTPSLARKQGAYSVVAASGLVMKRGHDLERVLGAFDKPLKLVRA